MAKAVKKTFYDKDFVPKNLEELYCSGWKDYILYHIRKYSLHDVNNSPEDLLQDIMVQMAEKNYLEKYDPEVSEFTVYLHTFIKNFMSRPYNKEHKTVNGYNIVNRLSLVITDPDLVDGVSDSGDVVSSEVLDNGDGDFTEYLCLKQALEKDLNEIKSKSQIEYNGKVINRNPLTVYNMLQEGYDIKEIAEIFGVSKQFVYNLRKKVVDVIASYA